MQYFISWINYFTSLSAHKKKTENTYDGEDDEESINIKQISKDEYEKSTWILLEITCNMSVTNVLKKQYSPELTMLNRSLCWSHVSDSIFKIIDINSQHLWRLINNVSIYSKCYIFTSCAVWNLIFITWSSIRWYLHIIDSSQQAKWIIYFSWIMIHKERRNKPQGSNFDMGGRPCYNLMVIQF